MILYCMDNSYDQIIPKVGLGTYNMDSNESEFMTYEAIKYGYRHIDTAAVYKNEDGVSRALERIFNETQLKREDIFITTKLWPGGLIKLDRVRDYKVVKPFFQRIFGLGKIELVTSDRSNSNINLNGIKDPENLYNLIRDNVEKIRR